MRGFSKSYAMTGWRLAYVAAPGLASSGHGGNDQDSAVHVRLRPDAVPEGGRGGPGLRRPGSREGLYPQAGHDLHGLKDKFELVKPQGAFYAFVKAPGGSGSEFVKRAIQNNVLVIPGNVFSEKDTHFRISFATTDEKIRQGIDILRRLA